MMRKKNKSGAFGFLLFAGILSVVWIAGNRWFFRADLTEDKRYSLNPATIEVLKKLEDVVYFKVYLEGEFPSGYKKLRDEIKLMLDQFRAYAGENIQYVFINPSESSDVKQQREVYQQLVDQGLEPSTLTVRDAGGEKQQIIFPGALVSYREKTVAAGFLRNQLGTGSDEMLNHSIENLEFELLFAIQKLRNPIKKRIAFLEGHGELGELYVRDLMQSLSEVFEVERIRLNGQLAALQGYSAVVCVKPDSMFNEKDKFILDQFVMRGGKMLWMLDGVSVSMDSLRKGTSTMALPLNCNLDDQLFRYGVRINKDLVMDLQCAPIPVISGYTGGQPRQSLYPWYYFPLSIPDSKHPIVRNLNITRFEFASTIDTVSNPGVRKTILLGTSGYSKVQRAPVVVDLRLARSKAEGSMFPDRNKALAVLLEGTFQSVYKNRLTSEISQSSEIRFRAQSEPGKMIVISDGDVARNSVQASTGRVFPLGYDRYANETFGNKTFLLNCIYYLLDDEGILVLRNRETKMRLLDKPRIESNINRIKSIAIAGPLLIILLTGLIIYGIRRKSYGR